MSLMAGRHHDYDDSSEDEFTPPGTPSPTPRTLSPSDVYVNSSRSYRDGYQDALRDLPEEEDPYMVAPPAPQYLYTQAPPYSYAPQW